ncbi:unnamed protein product [Amoebophrya sp. A25]|nr:unnamed protein product [Amoebophrya sp. A25]|eukprot:GSA25T00024533001.1
MGKARKKPGPAGTDAKLAVSPKRPSPATYEAACLKTSTPAEAAAQEATTDEPACLKTSTPAEDAVQPLLSCELVRELSGNSAGASSSSTSVGRSVDGPPSSLTSDVSSAVVRQTAASSSSSSSSAAQDKDSCVSCDVIPAGGAAGGTSPMIELLDHPPVTSDRVATTETTPMELTSSVAGTPMQQFGVPPVGPSPNNALQSPETDGWSAFFLGSSSKHHNLRTSRTTSKDGAPLTARTTDDDDDNFGLTFSAPNADLQRVRVRNLISPEEPSSDSLVLHNSSEDTSGGKSSVVLNQVAAAPEGSSANCSKRVFIRDTLPCPAASSSFVSESGKTGVCLIGANTSIVKVRQQTGPGDQTTDGEIDSAPCSPLSDGPKPAPQEMMVLHLDPSEFSNLPSTRSPGSNTANDDVTAGDSVSQVWEREREAMRAKIQALESQVGVNSGAMTGGQALKLRLGMRNAGSSPSSGLRNFGPSGSCPISGDTSTRPRTLADLRRGSVCVQPNHTTLADLRRGSLSIETRKGSISHDNAMSLDALRKLGVSGVRRMPQPTPRELVERGLHPSATGPPGGVAGSTGGNSNLAKLLSRTQRGDGSGAASAAAAVAGLDAGGAAASSAKIPYTGPGTPPSPTGSQLQGPTSASTDNTSAPEHPRKPPTLGAARSLASLRSSDACRDHGVATRPPPAPGIPLGGSASFKPPKRGIKVRTLQQVKEDDVTGSQPPLAPDVIAALNEARRPSISLADLRRPSISLIDARRPSVSARLVSQIQASQRRCQPSAVRGAAPSSGSQSQLSSSSSGHNPDVPIAATSSMLTHQADDPSTLQMNSCTSTSSTSTSTGVPNVQPAAVNAAEAPTTTAISGKVVLIGSRGVGKSVLCRRLTALAEAKGWLKKSSHSSILYTSSSSSSNTNKVGSKSSTSCASDSPDFSTTTGGSATDDAASPPLVSPPTQRTTQRPGETSAGATASADGETRSVKETSSNTSTDLHPTGTTEGGGPTGTTGGSRQKTSSSASTSAGDVCRIVLPFGDEESVELELHDLASGQGNSPLPLNFFRGHRVVNLLCLDMSDDTVEENELETHEIRLKEALEACNAKSGFIVGTKSDLAKGNARENLAFFAAQKNMPCVFLCAAQSAGILEGSDQVMEQLLRNIAEKIFLQHALRSGGPAPTGTFRLKADSVPLNPVDADSCATM